MTDGNEILMSKRILIVDDREQVREDLRTVLTLFGELGIIGEAANGQEAIRLVAVLQPDVVLLDLEMPVMDGYEAASQIKALTPSCRVIVLTVHDCPVARQKGQRYVSVRHVQVCV